MQYSIKSCPYWIRSWWNVWDDVEEWCTIIYIQLLIRSRPRGRSSRRGGLEYGLVLEGRTASRSLSAVGFWQRCKLHQQNFIHLKKFFCYWRWPVKHREQTRCSLRHWDWELSSGYTVTDLHCRGPWPMYICSCTLCLWWILSECCNACEQLLGDLLFRKNEFDKAMSEFQKLLQEKPGY